MKVSLEETRPIVTIANEKIAAIANMKSPTNLQNLELYVGMTGWMGHYCPYFAQITEPLEQFRK